jgi:hypothetical protein
MFPKLEKHSDRKHCQENLHGNLCCVQLRATESCMKTVSITALSDEQVGCQISDTVMCCLHTYNNVHFLGNIHLSVMGQ